MYVKTLSCPISQYLRIGFYLCVMIYASQAYGQGVRIGYVDMSRLIDNAPQVASGRAALELEFSQRDKQLKEQEAQLALLEDKFRRERGLLPKTAAQEQAKSIDTMKRNITHMRDRLRSDLSLRSKEELRKRWPQIHDAIIDFAREKKYDLIIESPVIYASSAIDITDQIIRRLQTNENRLSP
jgi:outer membrane protein